MQKIGYNQRRKQISKLLIPVKLCWFHLMPANIVCAEMCSLTQAKLSSSCLCFYKKWAVLHEGLQKHNIFRWMPSAPAHGDELPATLTRSGGSLLRIWHLSSTKHLHWFCLQGYLTMSSCRRNNDKTMKTFFKATPSLFQTSFFLLDLHRLKSNPFAIYKFWCVL